MAGPTVGPSRGGAGPGALPSPARPVVVTHRPEASGSHALWSGSRAHDWFRDEAGLPSVSECGGRCARARVGVGRGTATPSPLAHGRVSRAASRTSQQALRQLPEAITDPRPGSGTTEIYAPRAFGDQVSESRAAASEGCGRPLPGSSWACSPTLAEDALPLTSHGLLCACLFSSSATGALSIAFRAPSVDPG